MRHILYVYTFLLALASFTLNAQNPSVRNVTFEQNSDDIIVRYTLAGDANKKYNVKESGYTHWVSPNTDATNESGFTALPGGWRNGYVGGFYPLGYAAIFWSSTEDSTYYAWGRHLGYDGAGVDRGYGSKIDGFSVRLLRD